MKKFFVLAVLFLLPILAYLFFASGVHNFGKLPILTKNVQDIAHLRSQKDTAVTFQNKISVVGFFGNNPEELQGNTFNLDKKILNKYYEFDDFQFVIILPESAREPATQFAKDFENVANAQHWNFTYGTPQEIEEIFKSFNTNLQLDENLQTPFVFIVDKEGNLRGRDDDEDKGLLYGYDSRRVAELNSKMNDDVKVILAEYRRALKKYDTPEKKL
ncbi:hypothetical protein BH23BAC2_BH23BAC2_03740 [soil metagenome]